MTSKLIVKCAGFAAVLAVILFGTSGRWDWIEAWVFVAVLFAIATATALVIATRDPALLEERSRFHENTKTWDKLLAPIMALIGPLALWIVAGLDKRLAWSPPVALGVHVVGFAMIVVGSGVILWAMLSNRFFSSTVRIQHERGHAVATTGPYRYVRHPGYVGAMAYYLGTPLALGSLYALVPAGITIILTVVRTALEDRTLLEELPGYHDYVPEVRYRLVPGVW